MIFMYKLTFWTQHLSENKSSLLFVVVTAGQLLKNRKMIFIYHSKPCNPRNFLKKLQRKKNFFLFGNIGNESLKPRNRPGTEKI